MAKKQSKIGQEKKANRLVNESSTYLLQHAYNPVNWFAWSEEALGLATTNDKPIMLSIGYSACHWCHVMEEESFQDEETAKIINEYFVPIKVDREERPDLDDIYMTAVQLMTGHGGWPLTVFLTPQQKPFYGGTYFPKEDKYYGQQVLPGFKTLLNAINQAWQTQRHQAEASADRMTEAIVSLSQQLTKKPNIAKPTPNTNQDLLIECANKLLPLFDTKWGGFGGAPKFPQTMALQLCLQAAFKLQQKNEKEKATPFLKAVSASLDGMANGGIYDHLGGGFARYSTDEKWLIPHFEKMLYDNALLVKVFLDAYTVIGKTSWLQVATETLDFISRELTSEEGGFYSALDADSEGMEGKFYVWQKKEIDEVLGADSQIFCEYFGVTETGNFEHKNNILFLNHQTEKTTPKIDELKTKLLTHRSKRTRPVRDDKVLTSWNGLTISAFVHGYRVSGKKKYLLQAQKAGYFILANLLKNTRLKHSYAQSKAILDGYLDDYAFFIQALIDLASIDSDPIWSEKAILLTDSMLEHFFGIEESDFFYTANDHEKLITRPKNFYDGPLPSATSIAVTNLLKIAILTNNPSYTNAALAVLSQHQPFFNNHPNQYASMINTWELANNPPLSIVFVVSKEAEKDNLMLSAIFNNYSANRIVILKDSNLDSSYNKQLITLSQKNLLERQPTIYICQGQTCQAPLNNIDKVKTILNNS